MGHKKLQLILTVALLIRLFWLAHAPHFGDMDWYFDSARTERFPLLGITSSITWLHQGPLWTYILKVPVNPLFFTITSGLLAIALIYYLAGPAAAALMAIVPFAVTQDLTAYHTSPIPLLFFVSFGLMQRKHSFLAGLFIGLLYQSHLLTFIYWPLWLYLIIKYKLRLGICGLGFATGILPFIISGPIQTFGIFIWLTKQLLTGFGGTSSGISTAYWVVLLPGIILALGKVLKLIHAYWNRPDSQ